MSDSLTANSTVAIVGGGQAGGEVASELRKLGYAGRIVLVAEEPAIPYKRPPLSKAFLAGTATAESLNVVPPAALEKARIEFIGNTRVERIDRENRQLHLADGTSIRYDKLALTTGGRARGLTTPGADKRNVFPLRTIADVRAIHPYFQPGKRLVIIGGGFIGLEVAAVAVKAGLQVTLLEGLPRVLARATVPEMSSFFEGVHRQAGVDLRTGVQITALEGDPLVNQVALADHTRIPADFVIFGIGLLPNTELAANAGLVVDNGIVVDEFTRTSDPDIVAAGDCTNHPSAYLGRNLRLESVQNAMEQGRAAAASLMGQSQAYRAIPWFWSDQYDLKLQMVGLSGIADQIVRRGDPAKRSFALFHFRDGKLLAADTVNRPQEFMLAKKAVAAGTVIDPDKLADDSLPIKSLLG